jgi:prepilin-type N-terminal cleavage/methylation domain-containing protein
MHLSTYRRSSRASHGFSLIELLTVVAILGVFASIALVMMGNINQSSVDTRDRRNAQELAAVCASAQAAGIDFVVDGDLAETIRNVVKGGEPADGAFAGRFFGLQGLAPADQETAKKFLELTNGSLQFKPNAQ